MANIRILYNNVADSATPSATTAISAELGADNLLTEIKTQIFRSSNLTPTITYNWSTNVQSINCVILPCTNLTETSTIRIKLYNTGLSVIYDSGVIPAIRSDNLYSGPLSYNVNLFSFGFFSKTAIWLPSTINNVSKMDIILSDPSNTFGYIDCSRVLAGVYWEPLYNIENGIQLNIIDESSISRTNAGNLTTNRGFIYDRISFNYSLLPESDKVILGNIVRAVGSNKNFFTSLFPDSSNGAEEHDFMIYGKRANSSITYKIFGFYNHSMDIVSW